MKLLQANLICVHSLLLLVLFIFSISASIYYEKPSSARLAAASQKPPACTYQNQKYQHGQQVPTQQPCLNCTCKKGVLSCYLRVCQTLIQSNPNQNCITVRETGQCCPTLKCDTITQNDITNTTPTIPTTKSLPGFSQTSNDNTYGKDSFNDFQDLRPSEKSIQSRNEGRVSITQKDRTTTIFQTSPSTTFHESLLLVTSSPASTLVDTDDNIITTSEGSCHLNGTAFAEGSAVVSTSFCEYCYCIRSKRMCIRPRCHLSILGCLPRYTSEYACCPTSYVCGDEALTTLPMTTTTTTTTTTSTTESVRIFGRKAACIINGVEYKVGDPIASDEHCKQCYCSTGGIKKCKKIQCSPEMEGCVPIIPDGHCCPVEYKCNSTLETTKSSELSTDSIPTTTEQNINDLTEIGITLNPNEVISQLSTTPTDLETNEKLFVDYNNITNSLNSNETNLLLNSEIITDSETTVSPEETNTKSETIQTESIINGQQLRSDDLILKNDDQIIPLLDTKLDDNKSDTFIESSIETTTDRSDYQSIDYLKNQIKPDLYSENQTLVSNDIEITTETQTTISSDLNSKYSEPTLTSETLIESDINEKSDELMVSMQNISNDSNDSLTKTTIISNKDNDTKPVQNETGFESVGVILQGIIHAIDKQLQRRIPAEPRLKNNSSDDEIVESKQIDDSTHPTHPTHPTQPTQKPMTYRSENKAGPSLSSSFFITDDNETPYKSDSDGVEIITAKTAFYDLPENQGDSILINLAPNTMKVSSSPVNHKSKPQNDKNYNVVAQNNRAAIYGRPANPFPQPYMPSNNDWRVMNSNFPRRPQFEESSDPPKPIESLYYNQNRRQDSDETLDQKNSDFDKKPRFEFEIPIDSNNRMKVIPFKVNDAVSGLPHKRKNGSFLIRVPTHNKNSVSPDQTSKPNQQISCFFNNVEYPNGAMIPKSDPCTLCRCFYGRELCQQQKCPAPPEKDCMPEKMNGYCCPRYICRVIEDPKIAPNPQPIDGFIHSNSEGLNSSPIRNSPQFSTENKNNFNINTNNLLNESNVEINFNPVLPQNSEHNFEDKLKNEENNKNPLQLVTDSVTAPSRQSSADVGSSHKNLNRISGNHSKLKPNENRIHFPIDKEIDSIVSQPFLSDPISPFAQTNPRPSKPSGQHSHYNNPNKFRLKPSSTMSQSSGPSLSGYGNSQNPNLRLPPFLLHTHSGTNSPPIRQKTSTTSAPLHSEDILTKSETINKNNISIVENDKTVTSNETNFSDNDKSDANRVNLLTPEYHSTTSAPESNHSMISTTIPSLRPKPTVIALMSSTPSRTTESKSRDPIINESSAANQNPPQNPWDLFRISSCNIYGTMYEINAKIERLSTSCKNCICSVQGVKCTDIC